jgi:hypothetical protein
MPAGRIIYLQLFSVVLGIGLPSLLRAQLPNSQRTKTITISDTVTIDTLSLVPGSVQLKVNGIEVPPDRYIIEFAKSEIYFDLNKIYNSYGNQRSLEISYKVFPVLFSKKIRDELKHSLVVNKTDTNGTNKMIYHLDKVYGPVNETFKWEGINKSGSFTRGVSFGNTQDATVISAFNLQLSGKLNNDVEILASITDENVPIQPNGNTQTLQDFDKIFIQLSKGASRAIGGDFSITKPKGYFLNMFKRAQGLSLATTVWNRNIFKKDELVGGMNFKMEGGVARGKFRRQEFQGVEGNQGPYRLTGNDGESQLIILSGSESVYIDGKKLERGQENDYIIDYNSAELTFTAKQIITKDKRIIVEFEYSDRKYQRWMAHFSTEWQYKKIGYRINYFGEFDDRNSPLVQSLTDKEKLILYNIGDTLLNSYSPAVDSVAFNTNEILYRKIDTTVASVMYKIYQYSTASDSAYFRLSFSNLGKGNGNYVLINSTANGRIYKWVSPDTITGALQGEYEPVIKLVTPKIQQMITGAFDYRVKPGILLSAEGAYSYYDVNTFSPYNSNDDHGYAFRLDGKFNIPFQKREKDTLSLNIQVSYEQVGKTFKPFIRFRSVEFERDWNFLNRNNPNASFQNVILGDDYIPSVMFDLGRKSWGNISYQVQAYFKANLYQAYKNDFKADIHKKGWAFTTSARQTATQDSTYNTLFLRHTTSLSKKFSILKVGINGVGEYNAFHLNKKDTLLKNSYAFNDWEIYVSNGDSVQHFFRIFYKNRIDHLSGNDNEFHMAAIAHHAGMEFKLNNVKNQQLKTTLTYRYLQVTDTTLLKRSNESTLLGRIEYNANFLQKSIQLTLFYEMGSGLENKRDYQYIQSLNALGTHVWIDYNGDGIKQRDEYEVRSGTIVGTDGLTYIKYYFPTTDFIRTYYNQFTLTFNLQTPEAWKREKGIKKFLSRFSLQTAFKSDRKTQQNNFAASLNPFGYNQFDSALVYSNYSLRQTLYFNRFSSKWSVELNYNDVNNKSLYSNGIDSRSNRFFSSRIRTNFTRMLSLNNEVKFGYKSNLSQLLQTRNYNIRYIETPTEFFIQPSTKWRIALNYRFSLKNNLGFNEDTTVTRGQQAVIHDMGFELKTNFILKGQLSAKFNYINITYNDVDNTALAFEMLEGLKTGSNFTWGASFQRTIGNNLQLTINYDGRKSGNANVIHIASMQIRAFF